MIHVENAVKRYGSFELDCSLDLPKGQVLGVIGRNGAGKTTLFKLILGLIKKDGGDIKVFDSDPLASDAGIKRRLGVAMAGTGFSGYLSVSDIAGVQKSLYPGFDKEGFLRKCRESGLSEKKQIRTFSSGMQAKLKILCALSHDADLLVLDEATAGLDVVARDEVLDMLRDYMAQKEDRSILISSHISGDLEGFCDNICLIDGGKIILREEADRITDEYGLIKADEEQYKELDKSRLLRVRKESYGICCLTYDREYYASKYPSLVIDRGGIDNVLTMFVRGEKI